LQGKGQWQKKKIPKKFMLFIFSFFFLKSFSLLINFYNTKRLRIIDISDFKKPDCYATCFNVHSIFLNFIVVRELEHERYLSVCLLSDIHL
jgi:hypothetical protein